MLFLALYDRKFTVGRGSEQLYNEELHMLYEIIKHIPDDVLEPTRTTEPVAKMDGAIWHERDDNNLKWWDSSAGKWRLFFENKFRLISEMLSVLPPEDPIRGQLWLHQGVLCYFDGVTWQPIQALLKDGSQFSLDVFKNFMLVSPLWTIGNTVVPDAEIAAFKTAMRQYLQSILDTQSDSKLAGDGTKWEFDKDLVINEPQIPTFDNDAMVQLLVPNIDYDRVFLDHELDTDDYTEVSKVCIQYPKNDLLTVNPSLVHLNPGRITKIIKTLVKVDKVNPKILVSAADTEYYGFKVGQWGGEFLLPDESETELRDYTIIPDGILLEYNAAQNYDYVLCIHYEFSWIKSTGTLEIIDSKKAASSYYIDGYNGEMNVFVEGFDIEEPYFTSDGLSSTITFKEDVSELEVSAMHSPHREYGYIRWIDVFNRGVIRPLRDYRSPLLFVNGEALSPRIDNVDVDTANKTYKIPGALPDMAWSIVELYDEEKAFDAFYSDGRVDKVDAKGCYYVPYNTADIPDTDSVILFIDGLLTKKENLVFDRTNGRIYINDASPVKRETNYAVGDIVYSDLLPSTSLALECTVAGKTSSSPLTLVSTALNAVSTDGAVSWKVVSSIGGLKNGQEYILLHDKYNWLYNEESLLPAIAAKKVSESLVYFNNLLLCNDTAIDTLHTESDIDEPAHNEIKCFKTITYSVVSGKTVTTVSRVYKIYNSRTKTWNKLSTGEINNLITFVYGYENTIRSIKLLLPYTSEDRINVYAFGVAGAVSEPLTIRNIDYHRYEATEYLTVNTSNQITLTNRPYTRLYPGPGYISYNRAAGTGVKPSTDEFSLGYEVKLGEMAITTISGKAYINLNVPDVQSDSIKIYLWDNVISDYVEAEKKVGSSWKFSYSASKILVQDTSLSGTMAKVVRYTAVSPEIINNKTITVDSSWAGKDLKCSYYYCPATTEVPVDGGFTPNKNYLRVWVNGVRIYPATGFTEGITEKTDGSGFYLPETLWEGRVTYVIEREGTVTNEVLGPENIQDGTINIYTTKQPLYPGRVTVYINGVRQPQDRFTIQDNYTIIFNNDTKLIGNYQDYPTETFIEGGKTYTLDHPIPDYILVEVRQDDRVEKTFTIDEAHPVYDIFVDKYDLDREILETSDEILIYIDGLFFGAKSQDGYTINLPRTCITISNPEILSTLNYDEQFITLSTDSKEKLNYFEKTGKTYNQYNATMTFEWLA